MNRNRQKTRLVLIALLAAAGLGLAAPGAAQWEKTAFVTQSQSAHFFTKATEQLPVYTYRRIYDVTFDWALAGPPVQYVLSGAEIASNECYDSWVVGPMTGSELHQYLTITTSRLLDIEFLDQDGWEGAGEAEYFAVVVRNLGSKAKNWWWTLGVTKSDVDDLLDATGARLVDLEYLGEEIDLYAAVMIANEGDDERDWFYGVDASPATIQGLVSANPDHRIVHIDYETGGRSEGWNYIFERTDEIDEARPVFNRTAGQIAAEADADDLRVSMLDLMYYSRYGAILVSTKTQVPIIQP